jgi:hypothetical protein
MVIWPQLEHTGASPMFSFKAVSTIAADPELQTESPKIKRKSLEPNKQTK